MNGTGANVLIKFTGDTKDVNAKMTGLNKTMGSVTKGFVAGSLITKGLSTAFNMISSSAGNAIKRIDTMNNFPKVMKNFGISADEAKKSVDRIDQSVRGLPTSLDQAVAGVQNIFMATRNLPEAEKMFQAINDSAMVFANGSTEAVDRFIYSYKQAMSAGKASAQDFNSMNDAIPGLMNKIADSMGITYGELKSGLSSGKISMDQFNAALHKLDTEGGAGMKSLQTAAKDATGGIQTAITNMKTAITRGLANAFNVLDKSLQDAGLGGVAGVITDIGKAFETVLKFVTPLITPLAQIIKLFTGAGGSIGNAASDITASAKKIANTITQMVEKAIKIIEKILPQVINLIVQLIPKIIPVLINALVKIVTALANAIPVIMPAIIKGVISIITALVSALPMIIPPLINGLIAVIMGIINMIPILVPALIQATIQLVLALVNALPRIIVALVKALPRIITAIITGLLKCLPQLIVGLIQLVMGLVKALPQIIKALVKQAPYIVKQLVIGLIQASGEMMKAGASLIKQLWNGFKSGVSNFFARVGNFARSIPRKIKEGLTKLGDIGLNIVKGIGNGITSGTQWIKSKIQEFVGNVKSFLKKLFGIKSPSKWAQVTIGGNIVLGIAKGMADKKHRTAVKQAASNLSDDVKKLLKGKKTNYAKIGQTLGNELISGIEESLKSIREAADKFKETLSKVDLWGNDGLTDLSVVRKQVTTYANNLNKLKNRIPTSLYSQIMEMDREQGLEYTNALLNMDSKALKNYVSNWNAIQNESSKLANQWYESEAQKQSKAIVSKYSKTLATEFASINKLMGGLGKKATQGLINGLLGQTKNLKGASKSMATTIVNSLKKALKIKSPSRIMMGLGKYTTEGFIEGITSMQRELDNIMNSTFGLSPTVTGTASTHFSPNVFVTNNVDIKQDPLGQMVKDIKTFSGGAKNDYNYGIGG